MRTGLSQMKSFTVYLIFLFGISFSTTAKAETHFGFGLGAAFSGDYNNIEDTNFLGPNVALTLTDVKGNDSFAYGFQLGHYFETIKWLGVEFEYYSRSPDIGEQNATLGINVSGFSIPIDTGRVSVADVELRTFAFNLLGRYQVDSWEPYAGMGLAINTINPGTAKAFDASGATLLTQSDLGSDTALGIHLKGGLKYKITDKIGLLGEYKYTQSNFTVDMSGDKLSFDLSSHTLMFGAHYSF